MLKTHGYEEALRLQHHLGLSSDLNSHIPPEPKSRARRGLKGLGSQGRKVVCDSALWLEEKYGCNRLSFLTLTLPTECMTERVLLDWSEICRKLTQWLRRQLEKHNLPTHVVGVVEIQEKRQAAVGDIPALHLHLVIVGRPAYGHWIIPPHRLREYWNKVLQQHAGSEIRSSAATRIERVRKSSYGYLGKYMSKGSKAVSQVNPKFLPTSWYICTLELRRTMKRLTLYVTGERARELREYLIGKDGLLRFSKLVTIIDDFGRSIPVAWYGQIRERSGYWETVSDWTEYLDLAERSPLIGI